MDYKQCSKCGATKIQYFPVEVNSEEKYFRTLLIILMTISLLVLFVATVVILALLFAPQETPDNGNAVNTYETVIEFLGGLTLMALSKKVASISLTAFVIFFSIFIIMPYKRTVRVFAVCQKCGAKLELIDDNLAYNCRSEELIDKG